MITAIITTAGFTSVTAFAGILRLLSRDRAMTDAREAYALNHASDRNVTR